ncbi:PREDICTED: protein FAR1-RELATED SEQUENCE 5-like [Ipomoea nil]|uniref:protein FAR1-RELATED SEQUENCE 5-like n=1 Tax=Ipomoea nil TaxID=35883 RepID=UPI000900902C|nr:PREDICTED: protein FAR1-RELATED SEQUENCE 5-like [Ipomoea nil]
MAGATHPVTQTQINVPILNEDNHKEWKDAILRQLRLLELDYVVLNEEPPEVTEESTGEAKQLRARWEKSNRLCVVFIKSRISTKIRFCFEDIKKAKHFLKAIDDNFIESKKVLAMTLIMKLRNLRLSTVKGTREHIMQLRDIAAQLKELEIILPDDYLVLFALDTLPQEYNPFKISYITHKEDWSINELITMCAMEEQRLVAKLGLFVKRNRKPSNNVNRSRMEELDQVPSDFQSTNNPSLSPSSSSNGYTLTISPRMTQYWTLHCEDEIKPAVDMIFKTLDAGIESYNNYAAKVGFDTRSSSLVRARDGTKTLKQIVCNREGFKNTGAQHCHSKSTADAGEGPSRPKLVSNRTGCRARIIFKYIGVAGYQVTTFIEKHNHSMSSVLARQFLKGNRNISSVHQKFILDCAKANIRASKSHGLYSQIVGDYSEVGATVVDFKNVRRDLRAYILGADAQILVHNLIKRQEMCPAFAFDYEVDEDEQMSRLFWADPMSKKNFAAFGDVVSFDATYSTNRYDMAMGMEPRIIVIDQDPAMKVAIPRVFKQARHRYCMWHIMCKVGEKVGPTLNKNEEFKNKLNSIVWTSSLEPPDFEKQWRELMEKYNLVEHNWFITMFEARNHGIPAYFRDDFMGDLLRTMSRSESENYTYSRFTCPQSSLVEFMMNFDSALKSQRNTNAKLNSDNEGYNPDMKMPLGIEKHASIVYTITVFYQVQEEICASCFKCMVLSVREDGGMLHYDIMDGKNKIFTMVHNVNDHEAKCSCKMFEMVGLLCRHIFMVFKNLEKIPLKYVVNRWTKDASLKATSEIDGSNMEQLAAFLQVINEQKQLLMSGKEKLSPQHSRKTVIESFCGSTEISEINILPPKHAKNKGIGKRIKSSKELAMEKEKGRRCNFCGVRGDQHDTRTCPLNPKNKDKQKGKKKA